MITPRALLVGFASVLLAMPAYAQQDGAAAPVPVVESVPEVNTRITPPSASSDDDAMLSTKEAAPASRPLDVTKDAKGPVETPFGTYQPKGSVGKSSESGGDSIPSGPHNSIAVPVVSVDELEEAQPEPAAPAAPEADPAQENPAEPTDLTSPIFSQDPLPYAPRKTVIRALNKVTAQSELIELKQNESVAFGQLTITAMTCRISDANSQTDYAGLLDILEKKQGVDGAMKSLFRGWMYATSPSIVALEHPVYDVTMVGCKIAALEPKKVEKNAENETDSPAEKPAKKGEKKPKN
jgi:hypothetical protein